MEENTQEIRSIPARAAGGKARAEAMTAEQRRESARQAVLTRWGSPDRILKVAFGSPDKPLKIGGVEIEAYVLDNGQRVLSGRGMQRALGIEEDRGSIIESFLAKKDIRGLVSAELTAALKTPISFKRPHSRGTSIAFAYEATNLKKICDIILDARRKELLKTPRDLLMAKQAEILLSAFAEIGIIALVDEVTGYQDARHHDALQIILDKYLTDEWAKWSRVFPDEFYKELFRLKKMAYPPLTKNKPSYIGHWTNDIVYQRLAPGVAKSLKEKNPRLPSGNRARKFHQHFTSDFGSPELKKHIDNLIFLMKACSSWKEFEKMLNVTAPKYGDTIPLNLPSDALQK